MTAMIKRPAVFLVLAVNSVLDIRKREIFPVLTIAAAAAGAALRLAVFNESFTGLVLSLIPGAFMALTAAVTGGKAGFGDALVLICAGAWEGAAETWFAFFTSLFLAAAVSVIPVIRGKKDAGIPFVPFVLAGYAAACALI